MEAFSNLWWVYLIGAIVAFVYRILNVYCVWGIGPPSFTLDNIARVATPLFLALWVIAMCFKAVSWLAS